MEMSFVVVQTSRRTRVVETPISIRNGSGTAAALPWWGVFPRRPGEPWGWL